MSKTRTKRPNPKREPRKPLRYAHVSIQIVEIREGPNDVLVTRVAPNHAWRRTLAHAAGRRHWKERKGTTLIAGARARKDRAAALKAMRKRIFREIKKDAQVTASLPPRGPRPESPSGISSNE